MRHSNSSGAELGHHINFRLVDGRVIAHNPTQRRQLARCVLRAGVGFGLRVFRLVDEHLHLAAAAARRAAVELVRRVKLSVGNTLDLPVPFDRAHFEPVRNQRHLGRSAAYILRQEQRHDVFLDPYFEASNLPDLLGLRMCGLYTADTLHTYLPRLKPHELLQHFEPQLRKALLSREPPRRLDVLPDAAAAAVGSSSLGGRSRDVVAARRAVIEIASPHLATREIADMLQLSTGAVRRLRRQGPVSRVLEQAVEGQLRLRQVQMRPVYEARSFLGSDESSG